jgi:hypothetical protein
MFGRLCAMILCAAVVGIGSIRAGSLELHYRSGAREVTLDSQDARQQLLATLDGSRDVTREVTWTSEPAGIVRLDASGRVIPVADGQAVITAKARDGSTARIPVRVVHAGQPAPLHFANQIVPIFTKNGCNGGGCHGKAAGQNGFRLSLLGFEPDEGIIILNGKRYKLID